jgi:hypothetical protein
MVQKAIQRIPAVWLVAFVVVVSAFSQDHKPLVGKWNMTSETSGDPVSWILVLKDDSGELKASLAGDEGEQAVKDLTFQNGVLKFKAPYQGDYYDIELKVTGEKLVGTWSGGGDSGQTSGIKAPPPQKT